MSVLPVVMRPDSRLSTPCVAVPEDADRRGLIADMFDTLYDAQGRGLAAPQVGVLERLFIMDATWKDGPRNPRVFVNPRIVERAGEPQEGLEACLSIPGLSLSVPRHPRVRLTWRDGEGVAHDAWLTGFEAVCAQHEIDHLDGILITDRAEEHPGLREVDAT
ncbi:peptide deformylase [Pseudaestuariivita atlantica]|uniref:Peptide deformylase n=1 Tax=Pseudaestuariivita atlantica TaxID=1317121 RepID=A0A0L1JSJ2_9RHOB|nr:peptide deformylase [Pseudaestuariivita atlantica]KNG94754.1 hypothetical protein ATO11_05015 [Pseudaestuariivita atlantica]